MNGSMARTQIIRGLERGLQVLQTLQTKPISSLHDIHLATNISKPSLLRILHTLEQFGMVSRRLADGHYRISTFTSAPHKRDRYDRVAEAAAPVLDRLCQKVSWPVPWTKEHSRALKAHSKAKTPVVKISKQMKRTIGALRQQALKLGIGLGHQR